MAWWKAIRRDDDPDEDDDRYRSVSETKWRRETLPRIMGWVGAAILVEVAAAYFIGALVYLLW